MTLYATITRITDTTSTVRVDGPDADTSLEKKITHLPARRTSLTELDTDREQASAALLTTAAGQLLAEEGFTITDAWRRLGCVTMAYGAHVRQVRDDQP